MHFLISDKKWTLSLILRHTLKSPIRKSNAASQCQGFDISTMKTKGSPRNSFFFLPFTSHIRVSLIQIVTHFWQLAKLGRSRKASYGALFKSLHQQSCNNFPFIFFFIVSLRSHGDELLCFFFLYPRLYT